MGNTRSAAAGLSTSSPLKDGDFGCASVFTLVCGGALASVKSGLLMRRDVVPGADGPSFSSVVASACPLSSLVLPPVPLARLELLWSPDMAARFAQVQRCRPARCGSRLCRSRQLRRAVCVRVWECCASQRLRAGCTVCVRSGPDYASHGEGPNSPVIASPVDRSLLHWRTGMGRRMSSGIAAS